MNILLTTDGSADARAAVDFLLCFRPRIDDSVSVLRVVPARVDVAEPARTSEMLAGLNAVSHELVDDEVTRLSEAGYVTQSFVADGEPAQEILHYARDNAIDLIVLGAQGAGGIRLFKLGSVTQRITHHAECSVLVVRPPVAPVTAILVATDGSESAHDAVDALVALPLAANVMARVLNVLPQPETEIRATDPAVHRRLQTVADDLRREYQSVAESVCAEVVTRLALANVTASSTVTIGHPAAAIVDDATQHATDLIVVGAQSRPDLGRSMLGSVAVAVVRDAPCSVLVGRPVVAE